MKPWIVITMTFGLAFAQAPQTPQTPQQERERQQAPESPASQQPQPGQRTNTDTTQRGDRTSTGANRSTSGGESGTLVNESFQFIERQARKNTMEIEHAQVALKQATRDDVKQFAQTLVTDHTKALDELKAMARQKGMTWPEETALRQHDTAEKNADKNKQTWDQVNAAQGAEFDRLFIRAMLNQHKNGVKEMERTSRNHSDSDIRAWATKTLPVLQGHLEQARTLSKNNNNNNSGSKDKSTTGSNN